MPDRFGSNESTYDALRATTLGANVTPVGNGDATYLRLDASNDPVTGALDVQVDSTSALRVLNSSSVEVLSIDTTNKKLTATGTQGSMLFEGLSVPTPSGTESGTGITLKNSTGANVTHFWTRTAATGDQLGVAGNYGAGGNRYALFTVFPTGTPTDGAGFSTFASASQNKFTNWTCDTEGAKIETVGLDAVYIIKNSGKVKTVTIVPSTGAITAVGAVQGASLLSETSDALTNAKTTLLTLTHNSSNTPAANFGLRQLYQLKSSTTTAQEAGAFDVIWTDATHATRTSKIILSNVISGVETQMLALSTANQLTLNTHTLTLSADATVSGSNTGDQTISLTGDVTGSGTGSFAATLATVNSNVGTFGDATNIAQVTVNAKGLVTAVANVAISGVPAAAHDILSTTHGDTLAGVVARGSLIVGNSTPKWSALALGGIAGSVLTRDANDVGWSAGALSFSGAYTLTIPATGTAALGTGIADYAARWTGTNALGTGSLRDNGTQVAINTAIDTNYILKIYTGSGQGMLFTGPGDAGAINFQATGTGGKTWAFRSIDASSSGGYTNGSLMIRQITDSINAVFIGPSNLIRIGGSNAFSAPMINMDTTGIVIGLGTASPSTSLTVGRNTTTNNAVLDVQRIEARVSTASTGGAAGFGPALDWYGESSVDGTYRQMGRITALWTDATDATRKAKLQLSAYDTAQRIGLEILASGTLPQIQLLGETVGNDAGDTTSDLRWETDTEANALLVDASADKVYIGGTTNGLEIGKGGTLKALGTATWFDDVRVEPTVRGSGSKVPSYTAWTPAGGSASGLYFYLFDNAIAANEKEVNFKLQMPHGKLLASAIHLHIHWMPTSTGSAGQKVRWGLEYSKANPNGVFAAPGAFIYATDPVSPPSSTPTQDTHYITEFADIDMTGDALSTILMCRLFRNSSDAADTFAGDAGLLYIDCHVEFSQLGSNEEYTQ